VTNKEIMQECITILQKALKLEEDQTLNYSKVANTLGISEFNMKFRKFVKNETSEISDRQLEIMYNTLGYELITIPIKRIPEDINKYKEIAIENTKEISNIIEAVIKSNSSIKKTKKTTSTSAGTVLDSLYNDVKFNRDASIQKNNDNELDLFCD